MYEQDEVVLIPFPYSDLTGAKLRPALIISNSKINKTDDRICCVITSNLSKIGLPIEKSDFAQGKLPFKSWVKPHRLFTINYKIINKKLCSMNYNFHKKVIDNLNIYLERK